MLLLIQLLHNHLAITTKTQLVNKKPLHGQKSEPVSYYASIEKPRREDHSLVLELSFLSARTSLWLG